MCSYSVSCTDPAAGDKTRSAMPATDSHNNAVHCSVGQLVSPKPIRISGVLEGTDAIWLKSIASVYAYRSICRRQTGRWRLSAAGRRCNGI